MEKIEQEFGKALESLEAAFNYVNELCKDPDLEIEELYNIWNKSEECLTVIQKKVQDLKTRSELNKNMHDVYYEIPELCEDCNCRPRITLPFSCNYCDICVWPRLGAFYNSHCLNSK